jgi:hypothetical protein
MTLSLAYSSIAMSLDMLCKSYINYCLRQQRME